MRRRLSTLAPLGSLTADSNVLRDDGFNESPSLDAPGSSSSGGAEDNPTTTPSNSNSSSSGQHTANSTPATHAGHQHIVGLLTTNLELPHFSTTAKTTALWPVVVTLLPPKNAPSSLSSSSVPSHLSPTTTSDLFYGDFFPLKTLGYGSSSAAQMVRKVLHRPSRTLMACKTVQLFGPNTGNNNIGRELDIHSRCNASPYIVHFYGSFVYGGMVNLCTEFMDGGSFDEIYRRSGRVPERILAQLALAVVKGLHYLRTECHVIHRDIKPSNILANTRGQIKLCDFSVSGMLVNSLAKSFVGCRPYMSPELLGGSDDGYTIRSDIWSLGISLIELAYAQCPIPPLTTEQMHDLMRKGSNAASPKKSTNNISSSSPTTATTAVGSDISSSLLLSPVALLQYYRDHPSPTVLTDYFSIDFKYFIDQCLRKDPLERPSLTSLMQHDFILLHGECTQQEVAAWVQGTLSAAADAAPTALLRRRHAKDDEEGGADADENGYVVPPHHASSSRRRRWRRWWLTTFHGCCSTAT